ncbi:Uu.00g076280.m01.CDS01 [Anthostomella pinea]|uniref:Uu.00g076280.m01.CDS01 n=1 Tax=Anthostomella pinea TaxID=933095 RepID=A0AAI8YP68_9PEZI|nr:Uu.00g076280.m01.CDS01 [Anthostomella pinea]
MFFSKMFTGLLFLVAIGAALPIQMPRTGVLSDVVTQENSTTVHGGIHAMTPGAEGAKGLISSDLHQSNVTVNTTLLEPRKGGKGGSSVKGPPGGAGGSLASGGSTVIIVGGGDDEALAPFWIALIVITSLTIVISVTIGILNARTVAPVSAATLNNTDNANNGPEQPSEVFSNVDLAMTGGQPFLAKNAAEGEQAKAGQKKKRHLFFCV